MYEWLVERDWTAERDALRIFVITVRDETIERDALQILYTKRILL